MATKKVCSKTPAPKKRNQAAALAYADAFVLAQGKSNRTLSDWTVREDDSLMEAVLHDALAYNIFHIANAIRRDPLIVLQHILDGELSEMIGFECEVDSEEEAEFIGLALSGVPLQMCFKWCMATEDRPGCSELLAAMTGKDQRPATYFVREHNLWIGTSDHLEPIAELLEFPSSVISETAAFLVEQFDCPTPSMVLKQLFGERQDDVIAADPFGGNCSKRKGVLKYRHSYSKKKPARTWKRRSSRYAR